jgi:hypothetical protein
LFASSRKIRGLCGCALTCIADSKAGDGIFCSRWAPAWPQKQSLSREPRQGQLCWGHMRLQHIIPHACRGSFRARVCFRMLPLAFRFTQAEINSYPLKRGHSKKETFQIN